MSQSENYPPEWKKLVLMVSPTGEYHAIGGDAENTEGEAIYPAQKWLQNRIAEREKAAT